MSEKEENNLKTDEHHVQGVLIYVKEKNHTHTKREIFDWTITENNEKQHTPTNEQQSLRSSVYNRCFILK